MKYKATARGVINITMSVPKPDGTIAKEVHPRVIEKDEVFDYIGKPGSKPPSWAVPVEAPKELVVEKVPVAITDSEKPVVAAVGAETKKPEAASTDAPKADPKAKAEPPKGQGNEKAPKP